MPSTIGGLALFVSLLVPGLLSYVQRRRRAPQRTLSALVESATLASISLVTNVSALAVFAVLRSALPAHTPDVRRLLTERSSYVAERSGYVLAWSVALIALSCVIALVVGNPPARIRHLVGRFAPVIVDSSAWYQVFEEGQLDDRVFIGCDLRDGTYVSGYLDWYSTEVDETADRDLVLAAPITVRTDGESAIADFPRLVVSAREIARLWVSFIGPGTDDSSVG